MSGAERFMRSSADRRPVRTLRPTRKHVCYEIQAIGAVVCSGGRFSSPGNALGLDGYSSSWCCTAQAAAWARVRSSSRVITRCT